VASTRCGKEDSSIEREETHSGGFSRKNGNTSGSSNDGNIARNLFSNAALSSKLTGIDASLIHRCATLLQAMASGYKISVKMF